MAREGERPEAGRPNWRVIVLVQRGNGGGVGMGDTARVEK